MFTPELVDSILADIQIGLTLSDTANRHRIRPSLLKSWYKTNHNDFAVAVDKAKAENKHKHLKRVHDGDHKWKSSSWYLERKFKDEYSKEIINRHVDDIQLLQNNILQILTNRLANVDPDIVDLIAEDLRNLKLLENSSNEPA
jgi:hypothetical protein